MDWQRLIAYVTGNVEETVLLQNKYLLAENRVLKTRLNLLSAARLDFF